MGTAIPGAPLNLSRALTVARLHGFFNLAGGVWPMVHRRSFEAVLGPKIDRWLVYTVAGLMACIGVAQTGATADPASLRLARRIGIGSALTLGTIDVLYAPEGTHQQDVSGRRVGRGRLARRMGRDGAQLSTMMFCATRAQPSSARSFRKRCMPSILSSRVASGPP